MLRNVYYKVPILKNVRTLLLLLEQAFFIIQGPALPLIPYLPFHLSLPLPSPFTVRMRESLSFCSHSVKLCICVDPLLTSWYQEIKPTKTLFYYKDRSTPIRAYL